MNKTRILGIDFGDKNIGLAVSDRLKLTAQPLTQYRTKNKHEDLIYFKKLAAAYRINKIVIGIPLRMNGTVGTRAEKTKKFASWLQRSLNLPVVLWDERLTTKQAFQILRDQKARPHQKKSFKDQISATLILSSYLESLRVEADDP